jgi:hypothetical protein
MGWRVCVWRETANRAGRASCAYLSKAAGSQSRFEYDITPSQHFDGRTQRHAQRITGRQSAQRQCRHADGRAGGGGDGGGRRGGMRAGRAASGPCRRLDLCRHRDRCCRCPCCRVGGTGTLSRDWASCRCRRASSDQGRDGHSGPCPTGRDLQSGRSEPDRSQRINGTGTRRQGGQWRRTGQPAVGHIVAEDAFDFAIVGVDDQKIFGGIVQHGIGRQNASLLCCTRTR